MVVTASSAPKATKKKKKGAAKGDVQGFDVLAFTFTINRHNVNREDPSHAAHGWHVHHLHNLLDPPGNTVYKLTGDEKEDGGLFL